MNKIKLALCQMNVVDDKEENLKKAYSIDVKLMELDDKRKVCVPMKTNLKLDL